MGAAPPKASHLTRNVVVIVVILVAGASVGYYVYQASLQPNIQATNLQTAEATTYPLTTTVQNQGRVGNSGSFSYTTSNNGVVYLVFGNTFSVFSTKQVAVSYSAAGASGSKAFAVPAGQVYTVQVPLNSGQLISGTFTVSGGSGNDIDFGIQQYTCSQTIPFSLELVNSGNSNGYVTVVLQTESGVQVYSNRYFVSQGQQLPVSGSATVQDCASHTLSPVLTVVKG